MEEIIKLPYELSVWEDVPVVEYYDSNGKLVKAFRDRTIDINDAGHYKLGEGSLKNNYAGSQDFLDDIDNTKNYNAIRYMDEVKSAIIGSDTMDTPIMAYNLILKQNVNGKVTLTFDMFRRFYNEEIRDFEWNPFSNLITNERKLKLKYKDQWFDLIIKEIQEDSDKQTMSITAESLPINELAKAGYNIEFNTELKNNIGTITELANTIVENTDWSVCQTVPKKGMTGNYSDLLEEYLEEPLYEIHILRDIQAKNIREETETITLHKGDMCYAFYSSLYALKNGEKELQILFDKNNNYEIDEDNVIVVSDNEDTNKQYLITDIEWHVGVETSIMNPTGIVLIDEKEFKTYVAIETSKPETSDIWPSYIYRGEKLIHNSCQIYEPISKKVCTLYTDPKDPTTTIYEYVVSDYSTDDIISNYIGEGDTFQDASGWENKISEDPDVGYNDITHAYYPNINEQYKEEKIIYDAHRYLCIPKCSSSASPKIENTKKINTTVQSAFEGLKEGIIEGQQLVFGLCIGTSEKVVDPKTCYTPIDEPKEVSISDMATNYSVSLVDYREENKDFKIYHTYCTFNDYEWGSPYKFEDEKEDGGKLLKLKDEMEEYSSSRTYYVYNETNDYYQKFTGSSFIKGEKYYVSSTSNKYMYSIGSKIDKSLSQAMIESGRRSGTGYESGKTYKLGLLFNCKAGGQSVYTYIEKIQLFDLQYDEDGSVLFIGSIPTAEVKDLYKYYTIPENALEEKDLVPYWQGFEQRTDLIPQTRDHPFEKVRTITGKQSNRFNLLQNLCETFECWLRFKVHRDSDTGKIEYITEYDETGLIPIEKHQYKELQFKKVIGEHNYRGFYYGTNLKQIKRTNDSNQIVTKLIVGINSNEFGTNGLCDITRSKYNPIRDTSCYNMDYYIKQGMIDQTDYILDLTVEYDGHLNYYSTLNNITTQYENINNSVTSMYNSLYSIQSNQEVFGKLRDEARSDMDDAIEDIKEFLNLPSSTSDTTALKKITKVINDEKELDRSTPLRRLTKYRTALYNYNTYSILADQYDREEPIAKGKIIAKQKELEELLKQRKEIVNKFYKKYCRFIQEGSWLDENYYDDDKYYLDAQNVLYDSAFPQVKYTINVIDLDELFGYQNYKYNLGDITYIEDTEFFGYITKDGLKTPYQEQVLISETTDYLEEPEKNVISIQNYKTQFEDLFQRITATTQTLQYASGAYDRTTSVINLDGTINQQMLSESMQNILGAISNGIDKTTELNEDGILSRNSNNKDWLVRFKNGAISTSQDNGVTWWDVLTPAGINVSKLTAGSIDTSSITIYGGSGGSAFRWDSSNLIAYKVDSSSKIGYVKDTYAAFNYEGIRVVQNGNLRVRAGRLEENNYGFSLYRKNSKNEDEQTFYAEADTGNLYLTGTITAEGGQIGGWTIEKDKSLYTEDKEGKELYLGTKGITSTITDHGSISNIVFKAKNGFAVTSDGTLYASRGYFSGTITGSSIYIPNSKSPKFSVTSNGIMTASGATIKGKTHIKDCTIDDCNIVNCKIDGAQINSLSFSKITSNSSSTINSASLYCNNLQASGGTIGGWYLDDSYIMDASTKEKSTIILNQTDPHIKIGGYSVDDCVFSAKGRKVDDNGPWVAIGGANRSQSTEGGAGPSEFGILKSYGNVKYETYYDDRYYTLDDWKDLAGSKYYNGKTQTVLLGDHIALVFVNGLYVGWSNWSSHSA